jgi:putative hydrolases of HD superfamily
MDPVRLEQQLEFIMEIDKLKRVYRQTYLLNGQDKENDAEHSWHLAVMALLLHEYAAQKVDLAKVIKMVLVHDLVEIDAGDSFCYDEAANADKGEREEAAAARLFGLLPRDQGRLFRELWEEFEERKTPEACFAAALDRLQPLLHNYHTKGISWQEHKVTEDMVLERNCHIREGSPGLWEYAKGLIADAVDKGYLQGSGKRGDQTGKKGR